MSLGCSDTSCQKFPECEWLYDKIKSHMKIKTKSKNNSDFIVHPIQLKPTTETYNKYIDIMEEYKRKRKLIIPNDSFDPSTIPVSTR